MVDRYILHILFDVAGVDPTQEDGEDDWVFLLEGDRVGLSTLPLKSKVLAGLSGLRLKPDVSRPIKYSMKS